MHAHIYICIHIYTHIHTHVHIYSYTSSTAISTGASNELAQRAMMKMLADEAQRRCARETLHCSEAMSMSLGAMARAVMRIARARMRMSTALLLQPLCCCHCPSVRADINRPLNRSGFTGHTLHILHIQPRLRTSRQTAR